MVFCAWHFAVYALLLVGVYGLFHTLVNQRLTEAFFSLDDLLQYQTALAAEDYGAIPLRGEGNASFLIFDEEGRTVYASNRSIGEKVFFQDLDMLDDYHAGKLLDVFREETAAGETRYTVYLSAYAGSKAPQRLASCVLDGDYRILSGDLFAGREALTPREFDLLCGISKTNSLAEKYTYQTDDGQGRTLVFFSTQMGERAYDRAIHRANVPWLAGVPCILLITAGCILVFARRMEGRIRPLGRAMEAYSRGEEGEPADLPAEFTETVASFRRLLDQLESARREKEGAFQEKQALIAHISHDLRTPLTVIQGYTEALAQGRVPPEQVPQVRQAVLSKARLAADLVGDLFLFTQMEHPDYPLQGEVGDLAGFLREALAEKYPELTQAGFSLEVDLPEEPVPLWFDRRLLRRLMENLLNNALQHNPPGTTLLVALAREEAALRLTVADDGTGIPPALARSLFQPFITGNRARTTGKGTGLGLSIVQRIAAMHGGEIRVVLPPHAPWHTEFAVSFPLPGEGEGEGAP